jgi:hypothetical protein
MEFRSPASMTLVVGFLTWGKWVFVLNNLGNIHTDNTSGAFVVLVSPEMNFVNSVWKAMCILLVP